MEEVKRSVVALRGRLERARRNRDQNHHHIPRWVIIATAGMLSVLIIFSHRPDALLNPQFLAEDGAYFYAQAYNLGPWRALTIPVAGYLVTNARLAGLIAVAFPVAWGPAIFNVLAILVQTLPALFLFTMRFDHLVPNWFARVALAFFYLALPNSYELDAVITNSQWHLALLAAMVVIAAPPPNRRWRVFDLFVILLAGLSGPFCLLLVPVIALRWLRIRTPHLRMLFGANLITCATQGLILLTSGASQRAHVALGISIVELARIIAGQIFVAATVGMQGYILVGATAWWSAGWLPLMIAVACGAYLAYTLRAAPQELRLLWLFGALVLAASLFSPVIPGPGTYWQRLAHPGWNLRYEYLLSIAWLSTLIWVFSARPKTWLRRLTFTLLMFTCMAAIPLDWMSPRFENDHYQAYVRRFEQLPAGSHMIIPLNPAGWTMELIKR
jgi:hypothetical protein